MNPASTTPSDKPSAPTLSATGNGSLVVELAGSWTFPFLSRMEDLLASLPRDPQPMIVRCSAIEHLDITGAWLIRRTLGRLEAAGANVDMRDREGPQLHFLDLIEQWPGDAGETPSAPGPLRRIGLWLDRLGVAAVNAVADVGRVLHLARQGLLRPTPLAFRETISQMYGAGLQAVPIVLLLAFLMGVVLAYQGGRQLGDFGAELMTVDLVAIAMWREMGGLVTAIIVAGRSGSAFAATLGTMRMNEELDALRVSGVDPMNALVAPRIVALVAVMPVLTILANVAGMFGAWTLASLTLDVSASQFLVRARDALELGDYITGMVRVPVFAAIIAAVATLRGLEVERSAEELGRQTTRAVVHAITGVLVADAAFSVAFAELGL